MSYRVGTTHYNLPQTEGTDKRDWFDTNEAFRQIDEAIHSAVEGVGSASAQIEAIQTDVNNVKDDVEQMGTKVETIETQQSTDEEYIAQNAQAISQLNTKVNSLDTDLAEMIEVTEEESATASVQHNVGTYFRYNDNLWITTVLIRVGDEIVPNVNCETTDVMTRVYNLEHSGGGSVSADAVSFDNTGTDLVSTNVEAVVKEVNNKIPSDEPVEGDTRYNTLTHKLQYFDGTNWVDISTGGGSMECVKSGTFTSTTTIDLSEFNFTSGNDYMVNIHTNARSRSEQYAVVGAGGPYDHSYGFGEGAYVSARSATSVTITVNEISAGSYEIIRL